jgi:hypothetical protein
LVFFKLLAVTFICALAEFPSEVFVKDVSGFTCSVYGTSGLWKLSLATQKQWRADFQAEKERIAKRKKELASIQNIKDPEMRQLRMQQLDEDPEGHVSNLPDPVLYSLPSGRNADANDEGEDGPGQEGRTGIPHFKLIMRVDIQGKFGKEKSVTAFQNSFGTLPHRAMLEVTQMLFKSSRRGGGDRPVMQLPQEIFLKDPVIMQDFSRLKAFQPEEINMDGFRKAGSDLHLYNRVIEVVRSCEDPAGKIHFLNDFYERITRQHISSILNKELRSSNALYQASIFACLAFSHKHTR